MGKRRWSTDYRLWVLAAGGIFIPLGFVDLLGGGSKGESSLWAYLRLMAAGGHNTQALVLVFVIQAMFLAVPSAALGWLAQAVFVMCGVRLSDRPDRQLVRDYREPEVASEPVNGLRSQCVAPDRGRMGGPGR